METNNSENLQFGPERLILFHSPDPQELGIQLEHGSDGYVRITSVPSDQQSSDGSNDEDDPNNGGGGGSPMRGSSSPSKKNKSANNVIEGKIHTG
eukprot:CAMPEP_0183741952 /NCGR_PEP_ID=MMETSP0737-20130205/63595_1 /TAXON_ID=385413 /ORGANISM="Thalassiosira miniscula, Strain CCMP1093" /LENGTH=94 /DNA_ID=CAMNT_0025977455 /DNA_START=51 /DNA_END=331 /DNA_ORIENTATION=-